MSCIGPDQDMDELLFAADVVSTYFRTEMAKMVR
jgi:hypothetical protein